jgi:hypothetical protein
MEPFFVLLYGSFVYLLGNNLFPFCKIRFKILVFIMVWFMVFNATFNNISVTSWLSVLLVEETGVSRENPWPVASHWRTLPHIMAMVILKFGYNEKVSRFP